MAEVHVQKILTTNIRVTVEPDEVERVLIEAFRDRFTKGWCGIEVDFDARNDMLHGATLHGSRTEDCSED